MEEEKRSILSEGTLMPLSFILVLAGGIVWVTTIYAQNISNAKAIEELRKNQEQYSQDLGQIKSDVAYIRGFLTKEEK